MRRIPISQFASIISFTLSMVKCPCFRPAFPINRFITVGKPLYKAVGLLRRKIFGKFNDPVVIQSICRMLFSVWRCELEPGSHTTQLIAFSLQLRLQIFPVIPFFFKSSTSRKTAMISSAENHHLSFGPVRAASAATSVSRRFRNRPCFFSAWLSKALRCAKRKQPLTSLCKTAAALLSLEQSRGKHRVAINLSYSN